MIRFPGIWKGIMPMIGGAFMIIMGLNLTGLFPLLRRLNPRMPVVLTRSIHGKRGYDAVMIGLLSGLLP